MQVTKQKLNFSFCHVDENTAVTVTFYTKTATDLIAYLQNNLTSYIVTRLTISK